MRRLLLACLAMGLLAGCASSHVGKTDRSGSRAPAQSGSSSTSPLPQSSIIKSQQANAKAQKSAAKSVPGAPGSGATQPNDGPGQVMRNGQVPKPTEKAAAQPFGKTVQYPDGVQVDVVGITHATATDQGRGAEPGAAVTIFKIRMTNESASKLDLNQVVVTATLERGQVRAQPIYLTTTNDFYGSLQPKTSATTNYAFTIPTADLGSVALTVDFDGRHYPAVLHGSAR